MKKIIIPLISLIIALIFAFYSFYWWNNNSAAASTSKNEVDFLILKGRSASQIGEKLYNEGLIKNPLAFKIYVQITGKAEKIQAGEFRLSPNLNLYQIVERLQSGPLELWVTIPEGLRKEEVVEKVIESLEMQGQEAQTFRNEFLSLTANKEGYLFPDTYLFPRDVIAAKVVNKLNQTFEQKIQDYNEGLAESNYSLQEIVTIASIIERETKSKEEKPIVAGILYKRLESGWPLQVDASVQYAVATEKCSENLNCEWWSILTKEDLKIQSAFNSYENINIPPAPIANPGLSSLEAAIFPEESDYWYYIHDDDGVIHFAETISEHNANVRRYLGK